MPFINRPRGRRTRPNNNSNMRALRNHLRRLNLTTEPTWHLSKNRNNTDPPPYSEDTSYVRRVRFTRVMVAGAPQTITFGQVLSQIWPDVVSPSPVFQRLMVTHIKAWGPASPTAILAVTPGSLIMQGVDSGAKRFTDYGTQGSSRPYISLSASPKDLDWVTGTTDVLVTIQGNGTDQIIVDLTCHFSGTGAVSVFDELHEPNSTA